MALKMGALAFFGDKYSDDVRMIKIGEYSLELCDGTHLRTTGEIGLLKAMQVRGVAAGVRRIEALTRAAAFAHVQREEAMLSEVRDLLNAQPFEEPGQARRLLEQVRALEREVETLKGHLVSARGEDLFEAVVDVPGVKVLRLQEPHVAPKDLCALVDMAKERVHSGVIVAATITDGEVVLVTGVTSDLAQRVHAGQLANAMAALVDSRGGGRADMA
jgi:alanyl-tRNA synthetase